MATMHLISARTRTRLATALIAGGILGCSSTAVGVETVAGRYELRSVNGREVPVDALGGALAGELVLLADGGARRLVEYATSGIPGPIVIRGSGSYHVRGAEITLDLVQAARGSLAARPWRVHGDIGSQTIILRYPGPGDVITEEVYARVP